MALLAQGMKIPGSSTGLVAPSGISSNLKGSTDTITGALAQTTFDWIFYIAVVLTVLYIMWSGIQIISSQGDVDRLQSAKRRLFFAIIGLIVVLMSFLIVRVVITALGGNGAMFLSPTQGLVQPSP